MASRKIKRRNTRKKGGWFGYENPNKTYFENKRNCERYWKSSHNCKVDYNNYDFPGITNGLWAKPKRLTFRKHDLKGNNRRTVPAEIQFSELNWKNPNEKIDFADFPLKFDDEE